MRLDRSVFAQVYLPAMKTTRTWLGEKFSEGARLAWLALRSKGWNISDLRARMVGPRSGEPLADGVVDPVLYGDRDPTIHLAAQLFRHLGVPMIAWVRRPSRRFVLEASKKHTARMRATVTSRKGQRPRRKTPSDIVTRSAARA